MQTGYSRILSDKTEMIVKGKKCKQVGNICMDQCMIDVTDVNNINIGDEVILFGKSSEGAEIPIEDIASIMGTINYEILCVIGKRIPRVYMRGGKVADVHNYLLDSLSKIDLYIKQPFITASCPVAAQNKNRSLSIKYYQRHKREFNLRSVN